MRALHVGKYFPPQTGGIERFCGDLAPALQRLGVDTHFLVAQPAVAGRVRDEPRVERVRSLGEVLFTPFAPGFHRRMRRRIERFQPDIVHLHLPNPAAIAALRIPQVRDLPIVLHWQADVELGEAQRLARIGYQAYRYFEARLLDRAAAVIATSKSYLQASRPLAGYHDKTKIIPIGIDHARLRVGPEAAQWAQSLWQPGKNRLIALGRLAHYKGYDFLFRVLAPLDDEQLVLVGAGREGARLARLREQLGLADRVRFAGALDEERKNAALASADLLVMPSLDRAEAFGLAAVEATSVGTPVLASDIPGSGLPEITLQMPGGRVAPVADIDAWRKALRAPCPQIEATPCFSIDDCAGSILSLYRSLLRSQ